MASSARGNAQSRSQSWPRRSPALTSTAIASSAWGASHEPCQPDSNPPAKLAHCAIYAQKSSEGGLKQEFTSPHAQFEAAEAFIINQASESSTRLPDRYGDGGFSGGSLEPPALGWLLRDIKTGHVEAVVVG
ncbi:MAG: recombinase family protein [Gemmatales bacterium]|nr:recombinase family protein [Gemmatales bacterium]MDW8176900.1 recombinase family protein [Gemmatales bacterium]